jgi:hypothetical protein
MKSTTSNKPAQGAIRKLVSTASQSGQADRYAGKRRCPRFADGVLLEITADPKQAAEWKTVYMHNVSAGGCAFWSKRPLTIRTAVWVREVTGGEPQPWLPGEISHCTVGIRGFLVGVAFEPAESL